jgi:PAS domain S-box-containing protein
MTRILIVDDSIQTLHLQRAILERQGFVVEVARHGEEALACAGHSRPDVIVSDLLMPVMDGYALLKKWKTDDRLKQIPFIVYSFTFTDPRDQQFALNLGADAFLVKPAEPDSIVACVRQVLAQPVASPLPQLGEPGIDEEASLKQYNEILIRKLEHKAEQLVLANRKLQQELARRTALEEQLRAQTVLLRNSEERLRAIFDSEPECVKLLSADGCVLEMNPSGLRIVEADSFAEMANRCVYPLIVPGDLPKFQALLQRVFQGESGTLEFEIVGLKGTRRCLETHATPLRNEQGEVVASLGVTRDITDRKRANDELRESRERLQALSRQLLEVQEQERRRIARELHDEIGQALTGIKLNLNALQQSMRSDADLETWKDTVGIVNQTLEQVRNLSLDLRPSMLDDLGLAAALRWYLDRQARRAGFASQFISMSAKTGVSQDQELETVCFRIAQEGLTNIVRHAKARHVKLELRHDDSELQLLIADDGIGFDVHAARERAKHGNSLGLLGMEERVRLLGGSLQIDSEPTRGTRLRVRFPVLSNVQAKSVDDH